MGYIGVEPALGRNREVDDISSSFNGSTTQFNLTVQSLAVSPGSANGLLISVGGIVQNPNTDYTVNASQLTFTTAPAAGLDFWGLMLGQGIDTQAVADGTITNASISGSAAIAASKLANFVTNNADNRVITGSGTTNTLNGETNLTFDNSNLKLTIGNPAIIQSSSSTGSLAIGGGNTNPGGQILFKGGNTDANIVFKAQAVVSSPAERMRIDSSGRLMLGSTSVTAVPIATTNRNPQAEIVGSLSGSNHHGSLSIRCTNDSANLYLGSALTSGNRTAGSVVFLLNDGTDYHPGARIDCANDDTTANNDTPGRLVFLTTADAGNNPTERMRIDSAGRLQIGTTVGWGSNCFLHVSNTSSNCFITISAADNGNSVLAFSDTAASVRGALDYDHDGDFLGIKTAASERMRIDSAGRVGIGTSSPGSYNANSDNFVIRSSGSTGMTISGSTGGDCQLGFSNGEDNALEGILTYQHGSNEFLLAGIESDSSIAFRTGDDKRMIINSNGNIFLDNTFSTTASNARKSYFTNTGQQYHGRNAHESYIIFQDVSNNNIGSITRGGGAGIAFNTSSDYRLKENISGISDGITRLKQLKPSRFNFKSEPSITIDGFIAHEVSSIVPEAIEGEKDGVITQAMLDAGTLEGTVGDPIYQGIDQSKLVPLLTAALQEAIAKIETLETKVAALEAA